MQVPVLKYDQNFALLATDIPHRLGVNVITTLLSEVCLPPFPTVTAVFCDVIIEDHLYRAPTCDGNFSCMHVFFFFLVN